MRVFPSGPLHERLFVSVLALRPFLSVPILGIMGAGMGKGPALALLLAGPALSLPSMLVINSVLGPKKTAAFVTLVVSMATLAGWVFGSWI